MEKDYDFERSHLIALFTVIGFYFLMSLSFIGMFSALKVRDLVAWSNHYFELCFTIVVFNILSLLFYNAMVKKAHL